MDKNFKNKSKYFYNKNNEIMYNIKMLLVAIAATFVFASCNEDEFENDENLNLKSTYENPFNYVGEIHNQKLDSIALFLGDNVNFGIGDIYDYNVYKGIIDINEVKVSDYTNNIRDIQSLSYNFIYNDENALNIYGTIVSNSMKEFRSFLLQAITSSTPVTPSDFNYYIHKIESDIMNSDYFQDSLYSNDITVALSGLAIAKYSYEYWYNAYMNTQHPWHNIIHNRLNSLMTKADEPCGFWNKLANGLKYVAAVVVTAVADVAGGISTIEVQEHNNNNTNENFINLSIDIDEFIDGAKDMSATAWENIVE